MSSITTSSPSQEELFPLAQCTPADIPQMFEVWDAAFSPNPVHHLMWPQTIPREEMYSWYLKRVTGQMAKPELRFYKITDAKTDKVVAFARWGLPHVKEEEKEEKTEWPEGTNIAVCDEKFGMLNEWREKYVDEANTYVALLLATSPDYQKRGFGTRLLKIVLDICDSDPGKRAYIEASEDGYPVYKKLGFEDLAVVETDLSKYSPGIGIMRSVAMMREPRTVG